MWNKLACKLPANKSKNNVWTVGGKREDTTRSPQRRHTDSSESVNKQHSRAATTFRRKPPDSSQSPSDPLTRAVQLKHWLTAAIILHGFMSAETQRQSDYLWKNRGMSKTNDLEITFINHNNITQYYLQNSSKSVELKYESNFYLISILLFIIIKCYAVF